MINYPNAKKNNLTNKKNVSNKNRGLFFEGLINSSNLFYLENNIAIIHKKPTPIQVVKTDYSKGIRIKDAYFKNKSTTDYNGIFRGKYIDFETKETMNKSSLPIRNIGKHQINHLISIDEHGGIAFFIIHFVHFNNVFILDIKDFVNYLKSSQKKSIPYTYIKEKGHLLEESLNPRLDYLKIIKKVYF